MTETMRLNLKATNITLTPDLREYLDKKLEGLEGLLNTEDPAVLVAVELGRATRHHQTGDIFYAEITIYRGKENWRAEANAASVTAAIDEVRDEIVRELQSAKDKKVSLVRRSGLFAKELLRSGYTGLGAGFVYLGRPARAGRRLARLTQSALARQAAAGFGHAKTGWRYMRRLWRRM